MANSNKEKGSKKSSVDVREEINLQYHWYLSAFFVTYLASWLIPGFVIYSYLVLFYIPYYIEVNLFFALFTDLRSILASLLFPVVIILAYLIHIFFVGLITRLIWQWTEKKVPSKPGIIPRNEPSKTLNFYHIRSFLIKYPKHAVVRGPFPWLINWLYNFVGTNKIGKNSTLEEQFGADRFVEIGENCYIGVNSGFSSHSVEGIFGRITYFPIKLGDNVTAAGLNCLAPGVEISDNSFLFPLAGATKHNKLKGDNYYFGVPLRKIYKSKVKKYLKLSEEKIEKQKELMQENQK